VSNLTKEKKIRDIYKHDFQKFCPISEKSFAKMDFVNQPVDFKLGFNRNGFKIKLASKRVYNELSVGTIATSIGKWSQA